MKTNFVFIALCAFILSACHSAKAKEETENAGKSKGKNSATAEMNTPVADLATMLAKKQVPVLCYHHIREPKPGQSETMKSYSVSPAQFAEQMKALKDSGYETILPNQLYNYLVHDGPLPAKPVMLTFDDTDEEQFSIGYKEMKKYGFKGVFFIMTISINRPRYMTKEQLKQLADEGNAVESHTWDHHMVTKYQGDDWEKQFVKPRKTIEDITGKPATYFAYPFGLWNQRAIPELKKAGFKMAFSLSTKRDSTEPLYTIRRMIVPGQWSTPGMLKAMKKTFELN
jgi:peptidoglycan/xylan/chitin deacetylase (PgdA/CDA1 family)